MYDASLYFADKARDSSRILEQLSLEPHEYLLVTVHRAENIDNAARLQNICDALAQVSALVPVIWPVHPRTRHALCRLGLAENLPNQMKLTKPMGYLDMVMLEMNAGAIATDSGGLQKEAYFHRVPCVTLRDETEWVELLELGWNRLASPVNVPTITAALTGALSGVPGVVLQPYGSGDSARRIVETLLAKGSESNQRAELSIT
jgi:UDP-GlcNAc3NAcA epimerase